MSPRGDLEASFRDDLGGHSVGDPSGAAGVHRRARMVSSVLKRSGGWCHVMIREHLPADDSGMSSAGDSGMLSVDDLGMSRHERYL